MSKEEKQQDLPNIGKGVGGAGRVAGLLAEEKAHNTQATLQRLIKNLGPNKWSFLVAVILTLFAALAQVLSPRLVGQVITLLTDSLLNQTQVNWSWIQDLVTWLLLLYLINFASNYLANVTMVKVTQKVILSLRIQMQTKLNRMQLSYFDRSSTGNLVSLLTNDLDNVANTLQTGLTSSITAIVMMVGVIVMMLTIQAFLALLTFIVIPIAYYLVQHLIKRAKPVFQKNAGLTGSFNGKITEAYEGEDIVNRYNLKDDLKKEMGQLNEELYESEWKSSYVSYITRPAGDLIINLNYALVSIIGGWYVIKGQMTIGDFQAFISYTKMFSNPFQQVLGIMNTLMSALASAERIFDFLDAEEIQEIGRKTLDARQVEGNIEFDQVDFAYNKPLFEGVSLNVEAGQQIAIVGTTGAGKTTLVNLLMRFYEIDDGNLRLDGVSTQEYLSKELRNAFSMVLQDTWLFSGSIGDNIAYGAQLEEGEGLGSVAIEEIKEAARLARADQFIEALPDGYNTLLTEGADNISQGQRQLLTIARAIIKKAPIIILDEATSSVDTRTELLIQQGMAELTNNRTSFIIAHRLSTIQDADRIIVMDSGTIVETGTHEELLAKDGHYADLYLAGQA